ncbi:hypothetical protein, partial [Thermomonas sp.]|uniref:hypothetical protein n=1 Tax=Thermomonas sp. TaxID=1971895 RepID=UPI00260F36E1
QEPAHNHLPHPRRIEASGIALRHQPSTMTGHLSSTRIVIVPLPSITKREAGQIPHDYNARAVCDGCGAVAVHPGIVEGAPVMDGWPRLTSCPWCLYRLRSGQQPPRPTATCGECAHWSPDPLNPAAGAGGRCAMDARRFHWPMQRHACHDFTLIHHEGNRL